MDLEEYFRCPICEYNFDQQNRIPLYVCPSHHTLCKVCFNNLLKKDQNQRKCPFCKVQLYQDRFQQFSFLQEIKDAAFQLKRNGSTIRRQLSMIKKTYKDLENQLQKQTEKCSWLIRQVQQHNAQKDKTQKNANSMKKQLETFRTIARNNEKEQQMLRSLVSQLRLEKKQLAEKLEREQKRNLDKKKQGKRQAIQFLEQQIAKLKQDISVGPLSNKKNQSSVNQQVVQAKYPQIPLVKKEQIQKNQFKAIFQEKISRQKIAIKEEGKKQWEIGNYKSYQPQQPQQNFYLKPQKFEPQNFQFNHPRNPDSKYFTTSIKSNKLIIVHNENNQESSHSFIRNKIIPINGITTYQIQQISTKKKSIYTGIATRAIIGKMNAWQHNQCLTYYSYSGKICTDGKLLKNGERPIEDGEIVTITINTMFWQIKWNVGQQLLAVANIPYKMTAEELFLVILMEHKNDKIELFLD